MNDNTDVNMQRIEEIQRIIVRVYNEQGRAAAEALGAEAKTILYPADPATHKKLCSPQEIIRRTIYF